MAGESDRYVRKLGQQLELIIRSAADFDAGHESEALALATRIRVIVQDTRSSTSLLTHLGLKGSIRLADTAIGDEEMHLGGVSTPGLTILRSTAGKGVRYIAPLGHLSPSRQRAPVPFKDWWGRTVIRDAQGREFDRSDLVLTVADKDGGAHVDRTLPPKYEALSLGDSIGMVWQSPSGDRVPLGDPIPASIRQIAYEIVTTLTPELERFQHALDGPTT